MSSKFKDRIKIYTTRVDTGLNTVLPPITRKPERLHDAMRYAVFNGGKRIRPLLVYAAGESLNVDVKLLDLHQNAKSPFPQIECSMLPHAPATTKACV